MRPVILWFRRDLRLADNPAFTAAAAAGAPLVAVYVLDEQSDGVRPPGGASRWWLERSLAALSKDLARKGVRLILRRGKAVDVLAELLSETSALALHFMRDYSPWSEAIEREVREAAEAHGAECRRHRGFLLFEPETIRTGAGEPYRVFTPFSRACFAREPLREPRPAPTVVVPFDGKIATERLEAWGLHDGKPDWAAGFRDRWTPGETGARAALARFLKDGLAGYAAGRDRPDVEGTSRLSPHLQFGEASALQCWHAARLAMDEAGGRADRGGETFLKELLWREFSAHLLHQFPQMPSKPLRPEFANFPWTENGSAIAAWRRGRTGYPIVDAGMRQLWATGWMHNRVRMIAASFLVKHLLQSWQEGEEWFWDTLVDADIASNAANWQWVAGSGADAAPYFRIFNPVLQGEKFDPNGDYVRRWVPELAQLGAEYIHTPWRAPGPTLGAAEVVLGETYPWPIIGLEEGRELALAAYRSIGKG